MVGIQRTRIVAEIRLWRPGNLSFVGEGVVAQRLTMGHMKMRRLSLVVPAEIDKSHELFLVLTSRREATLCVIERRAESLGLRSIFSCAGSIYHRIKEVM